MLIRLTVCYDGSRYVLESSIADATVAKPWMRSQDHVAHVTSRLYHSVSVPTRFAQPWASGPWCVNHVEIDLYLVKAIHAETEQALGNRGYLHILAQVAIHNYHCTLSVC